MFFYFFTDAIIFKVFFTTFIVFEIVMHLKTKLDKLEKYKDEILNGISTGLRRYNQLKTLFTFQFCSE